MTQRPPRSTGPARGNPTVTTLMVAHGPQGVLLLQRRKPPNEGLWSPPGGKLAPGESPLAGALREFFEETGLRAREPRLAAIVSELDEDDGSEWLTFVFRAVADGTPTQGGPEGDAVWLPAAAVATLAKPPADDYILDATLSPTPTVAFIAVRLANGVLRDVTVSRG